MHSEQHFLDLIDAHFPTGHEFLRLGRGDDCAVLAGGKDICVSSDLFLEDVHFRRCYFTAEDIGYKALAVNISDIAAMGARPFAFTMDLMIPPDLDEEFWNGFFKGMSMLARQNDLALAGGDLSRADRLCVSISIFGVGGSNGRFVTRGNCAPGDILFTVGDLGLARAGLMTLEALGEKGREAFPTAVLAHLRPKPKVLIGTLLNAAGVKGLMDVSDGLARDLPRFLGPNVGADLTIPTSILNGNVIAFGLATGADPVELAMLGGEDYALLGVMAEATREKAASVPGFTELGRVTDTPGILVNGKPFTAQGSIISKAGSVTPSAQGDTMDMQLVVIGHVRSSIKDRVRPKMESEKGAVQARIELDPAYAQGLDSIEPGARLELFTWFHLSDRTPLMVHPRGATNKPLRGVFTTRSPNRPNPIGLHRVTLVAIESPATLIVEPLEAIDGTPIIDIKPVPRGTR